MKRIGEKITAWKGPIDHKAFFINKPSTMKFAHRVLSHSGVPEASDALAYEPVQRLLALGTSDGRVKILGRYGIESVLKSNYAEGTKILLFLPNSGSLLRVTEGGVVEMFDLDLQKVTSVIEMNDDCVECVSLVPGQPFIMLGCVSGLLRVCCMVDGNMDPITQARPVMNLRLLNYKVSKHALGVSGRMIFISVCLSAYGPLALMLHSISGLLVWNIRFSRPVCSLPNKSLDVLVSKSIVDPGDVTSACWIGKLISPYLFATGHDSGDVFTWCMPEDLRGVSDRKLMQVPQIMHQFTARPDHSLGNKILTLSYIAGADDSLLVFGGQSLEEPAGLSLFSLAQDQEATDESSPEAVASSKRTSLAWFGNILDFVLIPPNGSMEDFDDPAGMLVLTESGNLVMYDLQSGQPIPFSMPFQLCHKICSASLLVNLESSSALMKYLNTLDDRSAHLMEDIGGVCDADFSWVLLGGESKSSSSSEARHRILILGYEDGSIRFWSFLNGTPACYFFIERDDLRCMSSIKTFEFLDGGALLVVGDEKGHVFIFQLSESARAVKVRKFHEPNGTAEIEHTTQESGYQLVVVLGFNKGAIQKLVFHPRSHLLAALDSSNGICVLNLITLEPLFLPFEATRSQHRIVDVAFCETMITRRDHDPISEVCLFLTNETSATVAVDPATGAVVKDTDWLHPKNESKSVRLVSLNEHGIASELANTDLCIVDGLFWTVGDPVPPDENEGTDSKETSLDEELDEDQRGIANDDTEEPTEEADLPSRESLDVGACAGDAAPEAEMQQGAGHRRFESDDAETDALLAAAVAKIEGTSPEPQPKSKRVLSPWRRKSPEVTLPSITDPADGSTPVSPNVQAGSPSLLLVTETYIRLYAPHSVMASVRAPLHKISFPGKIAWAIPMSYKSPEAEDAEGGLLVLAHDGSITLLALPSLDTIGNARIDDIVDFPLCQTADDKESCLSHLKLFEGDGEGDILLCSPNGELIHCMCVERGDVSDKDLRSAANTTLYDWELAHAAHSASQLTQAGALNANVKVEGVPERVAPKATLRRGMDFFVSLGRKARDELDRTLRNTGRIDPGNELAQTDAESAASFEPPSLDVLFSVNDHKPPPEIRKGHSRRLSLQEPIFVRGPSSKHVDVTDVVGPASPIQRTAEEVRAKYGRPRHTYRAEDATNDVHNVMTENVSKLHERGERLRTLNDKTEDLVNDAESFAEMAKKLAQQKSKKWWQL